MRSKRNVGCGKIFVGSAIGPYFFKAERAHA